MRVEQQLNTLEHLDADFSAEIVDISTSHETPETHPTAKDMLSFSAESALTACKFLRDLSDRNPELAKKQFEDMRESLKVTAELQEKGLSPEEVTAHKFAAGREQRRRKKETEAKPETAISAPAETPTPKLETPVRPEPTPIAATTFEKLSSITVVDAVEATPEHVTPQISAMSPMIVAEQARTTPMLSEDFIRTRIQERYIPEPTITTESTATSIITAERPEMLPGEPPEIVPAVVEATPKQTITKQLEESTANEAIPPITIESETAPTELMTPEQQPATEPMVVMQDFIAHLEVTPSHTHDTDFIEGEGATPTMTAHISPEPILRPHEQPAPIVSTTVEHLQAATEPEITVVAPLLQEILMVAQEVTVHATNASATPEETLNQQAVAHVSELVTELFETLDIPYTPADIEYFIAWITVERSQPTTLDAPRQTVGTIDLEHNGTHEAKVHLQQTATTVLTDLYTSGHRLLGMLALQYAL